MTALAGLPLVSLITFLPLLGAIVIAFTPSGRPNIARYTALGFALLAWVVSLALLMSFVAKNHDPQFVESQAWVPMFGIAYKVGVDGLSLVMVFLTTTLTWISILASFSPIQNRVKEYMVSFLILEVGMTASSWR
jgi:NADH-quinone oxidoreductase subunit M